VCSKRDALKPRVRFIETDVASNINHLCYGTARTVTNGITPYSTYYYYDNTLALMLLIRMLYFSNHRRPYSVVGTEHCAWL
jgi:hypothetical protein